MRTTSLLVLILAGALYCAGCQVTVDDLRPFELRQGGGESTEPPKQPPKQPEPPKQTGKDVIFALGLHGID